MSFSLPTSIVLTVLFAVTTFGYLAFAFRPGNSGIARIGDVLHVLMSVAMLSMPWSWGTSVAPPALQIIAFGLGTLFYLVLTVDSARHAGHAHHGPGGSARLVLAYHVVMMGAMVVMGVMMLPMAGGAAMDMPGMHMPGSAGSGPSSGTAWTTVSWLLATVFAAATVWMLVRVVASARARLHPLARADGVLLLLMSAGMALAFLP